MVRSSSGLLLLEELWFEPWAPAPAPAAWTAELPSTAMLVVHRSPRQLPPVHLEACKDLPGCSLVETILLNIPDTGMPLIVLTLQDTRKADRAVDGVVHARPGIEHKIC